MQIPLATYRIQFHKDFGFNQATQIVDYLYRLGVQVIYASPIFKAASGSTHGYDVADPNQINPEVGTEEELNELFSSLRRHDMGWLQDIVPNHMVFSPENALLMDVLEKGYHSPYGRHFDIAWNHPSQSLRRRLLVPFLGVPYYEALHEGQLELTYQDGRFAVKYYDNYFPLKIESYPLLFNVEGMPWDEAQLQELQTATHRMVETFATMVMAQDRAAAMDAAKEVLWQEYSSSPLFRELVGKRLEIMNRDKEQFHEIMTAQYYRLAFWKTANREINYRRFFNINELISIRVEDAKVLEQTHGLIFRMLKRAVVGGVRIDHIDGLNDPLTYLKQLRKRAGKEAYIVVEKILEPGEQLPRSWPVEGTSGYDFLAHINGVFCDPAHKDAFDDIYVRFTGVRTEFKDMLFEKKKLILERLLAGDLERLIFQFRKLSQFVPEGSDLLASDLRQTLTVALCFFPVYRTYINSEKVRRQDRHYIEEALQKTDERLPGQKLAVQFLRKVLLLELPRAVSTPLKRSWIRTVMKFQQVTGPLMAKGLEDTTFYIFSRLLSVNEVGGNPEAFGLSAEGFHQFNQEQLRQWPHKMNATATHDTKRGEHVRARLNVLSEMPEEWEAKVNQWHELNKGLKQETNGTLLPDKNEEYFIYQTLLGSWPFEDRLPEDYPDRIDEYLTKAMREAKVHTDWINQSAAFEETLLGFARRLLDPAHGFSREFLPFKNRIAHYGIINSLSQVVLKIASPGVPDIYQGCELWDFSLVDPDNRRPVDYGLRNQYLTEIEAVSENKLPDYLPELLEHKTDGRIKLFTVYKTLQCRRQFAEAFRQGSYTPLAVSGKHPEKVIAFLRTHNNQRILVVAPRFPARLLPKGGWPFGEAVWGDTALNLSGETDGLTWTNIFTGERVKASEKVNLAQLFKQFPVVVLTSEVV